MPSSMIVTWPIPAPWSRVSHIMLYLRREHALSFRMRREKKDKFLEAQGLVAPRNHLFDSHLLARYFYISRQTSREVRIPRPWPLPSAFVLSCPTGEFACHCMTCKIRVATVLRPSFGMDTMSVPVVLPIERRCLARCGSSCIFFLSSPLHRVKIWNISIKRIRLQTAPWICTLNAQRWCPVPVKEPTWPRQWSSLAALAPKTDRQTEFIKVKTMSDSEVKQFDMDGQTDLGLGNSPVRPVIYSSGNIDRGQLCWVYSNVCCTSPGFQKRKWKSKIKGNIQCWERHSWHESLVKNYIPLLQTEWTVQIMCTWRTLCYLQA